MKNSVLTCVGPFLNQNNRYELAGFNDYLKGASYTGQFVDNEASGQGSFLHVNGDCQRLQILVWPINAKRYVFLCLSLFSFLVKSRYSIADPNSSKHCATHLHCSSGVLSFGGEPLISSRLPKLHSTGTQTAVIVQPVSSAAFVR